MLEKYRFRHLLSFIFATGIMLLALVTTFVVSKVSSEAMRNRIIDDGINLTSSLAEQATLALLYESEENASAASNIYLGFPDVEGIEIYKANLVSLYIVGDIESHEIPPAELPDHAKLYLEKDDTWEFLAPVYTGAAEQDETDPLFFVEDSNEEVEKEVIGYVRFVESKRSLTRMTNDILVYNLIICSCVAVVLMVILLMFTHRLTNPIQNLANTMRKSEQGESNVRAQLDGPRDIIEMQSAFNRMMETLENRENELKTARDQAFESARIKAEFAANVSHELRTPMNGVLGMLELLSDFEVSELQQQYLGIAKHSAQSLLTLINDVLDFSKNEAGKAEIENREFDLESEIGDIVALLSAQAQNKQLDLTYTIEKDLPVHLIGDNHRFRQILINLVGNALKFTNKGSVSISASVESIQENSITARFDVSDTGIGITPAQQRRIFDAFSQADNSTTRRFGGTGLGLAISRQFVELMGGDMGVSSIHGKGSHFWFTVPLKIQDEQKELTPSIKFTGKRLIFIDNNDLVLNTLASFIRYDEVFYQMANSGNMALQLIEEAQADEKPFDIVIVDEQLDGNSGEQLIQKICSNANSLNVMMVHQAIASRFEKDKLINVYLSKPLIRSQFILALNQLFDEANKADKSHTSHKHDITNIQFSTSELLLVEDNFTNQRVALGLLEPLNCKVDLAENGLECIEKFNEKHYDLILMDCHMPEMDGYEATKKIREMEEQTNSERTPIIAMTANVLAGESDACFAVGMDGYLPKPLTRKSFREKLAEWLEPAQDEGAEQVPGEFDEASSPSQDESFLATASQISPPAKQSETPIVDENTLSELREIMGPSFTDLVTIFVENLPNQLESLLTSIQQQNHGDVAHWAHTIKGSSANLGAQRLSKVSQQLELEAKHEILSNANDKFAEIKQESDQVMEYLLSKVC